jgi:c-di-GMP-binding flagellar brake protein YcgR
MEHVTHLPEEEQYHVSNLKEIVQILTDLSKKKTMLRVLFNHGADECLTNVIAVDASNHAVYLDIGLDEAFNSRLLASHHIEFSKDDGIRLKWTSAHVSLATLKDGKAIKIALPQKLMRLQRREYFRLVTPIVNPVPCQIPIVDQMNSDEDKIFELTLVDVSLGGIGTIAPNPLDPAFVIGANFDRCKISFPDVGVTSLRLQVRNITPITMRDGSIKNRIGFQYIEPSRGNEGLISRYTYNLERLLMALAHGT